MRTLSMVSLACCLSLTAACGGPTSAGGHDPDGGAEQTPEDAAPPVADGPELPCGSRELVGHVRVRAVADLAQLACVRRLVGSLVVGSCESGGGCDASVTPLGDEIRGLEHLEEITGSLEVAMTSLRSLRGFSSLRTVNAVSIHSNSGLASLAGLEGISVAAERVDVHDCDALTDSPASTT
jgi:hypothetical protein